jgi:predicted metal-dependent RNase
MDEIQDQLLERTGADKPYHSSTIWRALRKKIKYSLQVVTDISRDVDEEQRTTSYSIRPSLFS